MSTHVYGFIPPDETWNKMKAVWDACQTAGVAAPLKVDKFFGGSSPNGPGAEVDIKGAVTPLDDSGVTGFDVEIAKLPANVKVIRFRNSW